VHDAFESTATGGSDEAREIDLKSEGQIKTPYSLSCQRKEEKKNQKKRTLTLCDTNARRGKNRQKLRVLRSYRRRNKTERPLKAKRVKQVEVEKAKPHAYAVIEGKSRQIQGRKWKGTVLQASPRRMVAARVGREKKGKHN